MGAKVRPEKDAEKGDDADEKGFCASVTGVTGITCSFVVFTALNLAMLIVGAANLQQCPEEPMIPIYLVVAGSTSLSLLLVRLLVSHLLLPYLQGREESGQEPHEGVSAVASWTLAGLTVYDSLASIFSTVWLIAGSIYVYGASPQHTSPLEPDYCAEGAYLFAFIVITIGYISLCLSVVAALCHCFHRNRAD